MIDRLDEREIITQDIMADDIISHFEVLDCSNHRARHPFPRAFIVVTICVILFDIIKYNTVDVGSII
jgi:hypothetical protein